MPNVPTPKDIGDVVELLKEQHDELKELLPTVLQAIGEERATAFTKVRHMLAVHEALEQVVVHPHAKKDTGADAVEERIDEEEEAADVIAKLEGFDVDSEEFHDTYSDFIVDVVEHAEHEEHEEFGEIDTTFDDDEYAQVAAALKMLGDPPPANDVTFEQMLEDAKDRISEFATA